MIIRQCYTEDALIVPGDVLLIFAGVVKDLYSLALSWWKMTLLLTVPADCFELFVATLTERSHQTHTSSPFSKVIRALP